MKFIKISTMSVPGAVILSAFIISATIFITGWVFLGSNAKQKVPARPTTPTQAPLTPEQIKKMQEERAATMQKRAPIATTTQSQ